MLQNLTMYAATVNLTINVGPTKTAWIGVNVKDGEMIRLNDATVVPRVTSYRHLGVLKREDGCTREVLMDRVRLAWSATTRLKPVWKLGLSAKMRLRLFQSYVESIVLYGSASLHLREGLLAWLDKQMHRMRRYVLNVPIFKTHIDSLYAGKSLLSTRVKLEHCRLVGHELRRSSPLAHCLLYGEKTSNRNVMSPLQNCANLMQLPVELLYETAQDRANWAKLVNLLETRTSKLRRLVLISDPQWKSASQRLDTLADMQYCEEGVEPFWPIDGDNVVHCYTDGSRQIISSTSENIIGSAVYFTTTELVKHDACGGCKHVGASNVEAEIGAVCMACETVLASKYRSIAIHTDSMFVWQWFHEMRRQLRLTEYDGIAHAQTLVRLDNMMRALDAVYVIKVRAHCGNPHNEAVDVLSRIGVNAVCPAGLQRPVVVNFAAPRRLESDVIKTSTSCGHLQNSRFRKCRDGLCEHACCRASRSPTL